MSENGGDSVHPIFVKDPQDWMDLVHCLIQVTTEDGQQHRGYVYTVDPVSESVVLLNPSKSGTKDFCSMSLSLLPGMSIRGVDVIVKDNDPDIKQEFDRLFRPAPSKALSAEELMARRARLKQWLELHRLPVTLSADGEALTVAGALTVMPPFTEESCLSTNEIILARIRMLIRDMPTQGDSTKAETVDNP